MINKQPSQPEGLGVAFFATGPGLGLIMYILTTLEFPTRNFDFNLNVILFLRKYPTLLSQQNVIC